MCWTTVACCITYGYMKDEALTHVFTIRLTDRDHAELERAAKADDRPVTAMARKIIADWLKRQQPRAK